MKKVRDENSTLGAANNLLASGYAAQAFQAGATVTHPSLLTGKAPIQAVIVELRANGTAELDNGQFLPVRELTWFDTGEHWQPIAGYNGRYLLSSHGKVVSTNYGKSHRERLLKVLQPQRYPMVALGDGTRSVQVGINRLVAQHFLPSPALASMSQVLPKDNNHLNLRAENLYWADRQELTDAAMVQRLYRRGEQHPASTLTRAQVAQVRQLATQGIKHQQLAEQFGISRPAIAQIVNGKSRRNG